MKETNKVSTMIEYYIRSDNKCRFKTISTDDVSETYKKFYEYTDSLKYDVLCIVWLVRDVRNLRR